MTIFSKIIAGEIPCYKIAENEKFLAFLDIFPVKRGHTLIVPKLEVDKIFDVPDEYLAEILVFARPVAKAIEQTIKCNRVNIITVGLEVPHAHIHLIPTNATTDMHLDNEKIRLSKEELEEIQQKILEQLRIKN